ncbi:helix-turn-helix domain-containing protein [Aurantiacibacter odishensis]|uniref:helix-turn-helix domain-containing protein n=1 Tax=Aurantiacibacter odishensis TaxID=1155476 RepID=UPI0013C45DA6|nr:helix-turn-helix domain-containing protein [Aurantiacibacter odishensis]
MGAIISTKPELHDGVEVRIYSLNPRLQNYFTALYCFSVDIADGREVVDCHYPDWAGVHFLAEGEPHRVCLWGETPRERAPFTANGPTSRALSVRLQSSQFWSIGLNPIGWSRYAEGSASDIANTIVDGHDHAAFERLAPILEIAREDPGDPDSTARRMEDFLCNIRSTRSPHEEQVIALHEALRDPAIGDVEGLVERVGVSRRTLERLASRYFGFSPKLLLRRQRFLRSLGKYTRSSDSNWSTSLDGHYVDQAHFVRDFRAFMGMTPSEYVQMPHPLLKGIFTPRLAEQGAHQG